MVEVHYYCIGRNTSHQYRCIPNFFLLRLKLIWWGNVLQNRWLEIGQKISDLFISSCEITAEKIKHSYRTSILSQQNNKNIFLTKCRWILGRFCTCNKCYLVETAAGLTAWQLEPIYLLLVRLCSPACHEALHKHFVFEWRKRFWIADDSRFFS